MPVPASPHNIVFGSIFTDAGALWRGERELLVAIAGVFFFLPQLVTAMLFATTKFPVPAENPEAFWTALINFYVANFVWLLLINVATSFGNFAMFNLFLQGRGRTLGEVLMLSLRRFMPYLALDLLLLLAYGIGLSLLLVPGMFLFCRTWLAEPAYAAAPERGLLGALRDAWQQSSGWNWLIALLAGAALLVATAAATTIGRVLTEWLGSTTGAVETFVVADYILSAFLGSVSWIAFVVVRVALYRASAPKQGI